MSQPSILIIEDDAWLADSYQRSLGPSYTCLHASSAAEALAMIDTELPAVIVADVLLSGGTVIDLLHELQGYHDTAPVPVVLCSGLSGLALEDVRAYGVVAIKDKAYLTPAALRQAVEAACAMNVL